MEWSVFYRRAREQGVLFVKFEVPPKLSSAGNQIRVDVRDVAPIQKDEAWNISLLADLLVVGEAFVADRETQELSDLLRIHRRPNGFLMEDNPQFLRVRSNRRGIVVAGACRFPQELTESLTEARAAAQEVVSLLSPATYTFDLSVAEVDPKKCSVCYTCVRLCPHAAITLERYAERNIYAISPDPDGTRWGAAKVDPVACYGCGICVAECPGRAITLHHQTDEHVFAQMGVLGPYMPPFDPNIVAFCCDQSGYPAADMSGYLKLKWPRNVEVVRVPCAGRIETIHILKALENGTDGVLIFACHEENCQFLAGSLRLNHRLSHLYKLLEQIGLEKERLEVCHLSTNGGVRFTEVLHQKSEQLKRLGPNPSKRS